MRHPNTPTNQVTGSINISLLTHSWKKSPYCQLRQKFSRSANQASKNLANKTSSNRMGIQHTTRQIYYCPWFNARTTPNAAKGQNYNHGKPIPFITNKWTSQISGNQHRLPPTRTIEVTSKLSLFWTTHLYVVKFAILTWTANRLRRHLSCQKTSKISNKEPVQVESNLIITHGTLSWDGGATS